MEKRTLSLFARAEYQALQTMENYKALIEEGDVRKRKETLRLFRLLENGQYDVVNHAISSLEPNFDSWSNLKGDVADWFSHTYIEQEGRTFLGVTTFIPCLANIPYGLINSDEELALRDLADLRRFTQRATDVIADAYLDGDQTVMLGGCLIREEALVTGRASSFRKEIADVMTQEHAGFSVYGESYSEMGALYELLEPHSATKLKHDSPFEVFYMPCSVLMEVSKAEYDNKYIFPLTTRYCMPFTLHMGGEGLDLLSGLSRALSEIASEELIDSNNPYSLEYRFLAPQTMFDPDGMRSILIKKWAVDNHIPEQSTVTFADVDITYVQGSGGYSFEFFVQYTDESGVEKDCELTWFYKPYSNYQHTQELSLIHGILELVLGVNVLVSGKKAG